MREFISKYIDKICHALACFSLVAAGQHLLGHLYIVALAVMAIGVVKEFLDAGVPDDYLSGGDLVADAVGIAAALVVFSL